MSAFKLFLFGTPRLERDGKLLPIRRRKGMALLVYLAYTGKPHSRETVATLLWPDYDHSGALSNLRRELSRLKNDAGLAGGEELFNADRQQLSLAAELPLTVDVADYQALMNAAREHEHPPGRVCPDCLERLTQAVALYTDDLLSGFTLPDAPAFDDWQFFEAESLRLSLSQALQQLFQWHTGLGEFDVAIGYVRRWLALDPLHEPAQRELMALYARTGQQAAALRQYEECVRLLDEELGVEPEAETTQLYEAIRTRQFPPAEAISSAAPGLAVVPGPAPPAPTAMLPAFAPALLQHNLPAQPGPFVGRMEELATLDKLLEDARLRLISIVGLGGVGKTRLAVAAAERWLARAEEEGRLPLADGIYFVPLAALDGPEQIVPAIGNVLNLSLRTGEDESQQQLLNFLRGKELLLILDNFEHLLSDDSIALVQEILAAAPGVRLLLTSRRRLSLQGEQLFPLAGLATPVGDEPLAAEQIEAYDALELFRQLAVLIRPDFELSGTNLIAATRICQAVQGVPLGIELATGWLELLSAEEIAVEIERSIDFLESAAPDVAERQQSLRAMFVTSWHWLESSEQLALKGLSVFQGGVTREAAQAVTGASLPALLSLANKSWIQREGTRFHMHELLRQYVRDEVQRDPAAWEAARQQHAVYYAGFVAEQGARMQGPEQREAFAAVDEAFANIRLAWQWFVAKEELEQLLTGMLPGLYRYCEARLRAYDLLQLLNLVPPVTTVWQQALLLTVRSAFYRTGLPIRFQTVGAVVPADEEALRQAWSLATQHDLFHELGFWGTILAFGYGRVVDRLTGVHQLRRLANHFERQEQPWQQAFALHQLAHLLQGQRAGEEQTERYLEQALALFQSLGDERESGYVLRSLGQQRRLREAFADAIAYWKAAQEKLEAVGDVTIAATIHWQMGDAYLQLGEFEQAFTHYRHMIEAYARMGRKRLVADTLSKASFEAVRYGDLEYARESRQQTLALAQEVGDLFNEGWSSWEMGELLRVGGDLLGAREWFEKAQLLFRRFEDRTGYTFYHRGIGDIALARGDYLEAQQQFQASLRQAQATDNDWGLAYAWYGMGRASLGLDHVEMARHHFLEALQRARATGDRGITLLVLAGVAALFLASGESDRALELGTFVSEQPLTWRETREQVQALLASGIELLPEQQAALRAEARERELWPTVQELIDQLEQYVSGADTARLPTPPSRLVGRDQELADLRRLLLAEKELRVLTIAGPPGSGKSHLALATALRIRSAFRDDTLYVPLGGLSERSEIVDAIARQANFTYLSGEEPERQLLEFLREQDLLLLLDDLPVAEGALLVAEMLQTAPEMRVLVAATEKLSIAGETVYRLHGLACPGDESIALADAAHYGALALLLREAQRRQPDFSLDGAALPGIVQVARLSQGFPLALKLLASWLHKPGPEAIAAAMRKQLALLARAAAELADEERPVRAALKVSWQQLEPELQHAYALLSVFEGGFSRQAAQAITNTGTPTLRALAASGYLSLDRRGRYVTHELLRQFGRAQLEALGLAGQTYEAHASYFLSALRQRVTELQDLQEPESLEEIEADMGNVRVAWEQALSQANPAVLAGAVESLYLFCRLRGRHAEGLALLARAEEQLATAAPEIASQSRNWLEKLRALAAGGAPVAEAGEHPAHLPLHATPFVGRQKELAELRRLFTAEPDIRLVTVVGPGGIGKTRLAVEAARTALPAFPDGVFFVPLAPLASPDQIAEAIGESLGLHVSTAPSIEEQLLAYLQGRELLLVLDNFEHLMEGTGLVADIVEATRAIAILATSRVVLNLSSETVYAMSGLSYPLDEPAAGVDVTAYASVQLLLQQARLVRPLFRPDASDLHHAARIARLVQGMPLAIVLAAHWLELLSLREIAEEIATSLDFLEAETQDIPERQRSVRAVFDYSWRQLPADARQAFLALSVFRGGFTRYSAQEVTGARLRTLRTLVNKSFMTVSPAGRYEVHELLRQYGEQQLEASGEAEAARAAHGEYYLRFLQEREADLKGGRQAEALREIEADFRNVRTAWRWALRTKNRDAVAGALESLHLFCDMRGLHQQGRELFAAAREQLAPALDEEPDLLWGRIVTRHGFLQVLIPSDPDQVKATLENGLAIAEAHDDPYEIALATHALGVFTNLIRQEPAAALLLQQRALAVFEQQGEPFFVSRILSSIGNCYGSLAQPDRLADYMRRGLEVARAHGNKGDMALALSNLTEYAFGMGEYGTGESYARESLALAREIGIPPVSSYSQLWLGFADLMRGKLVEARSNLDASMTLGREISSSTVMAYAGALLGFCAAADGDYDTARSLGEASLANPANNTIGLVLARWVLAIAFHGLQDERAGFQATQEALVEAQALAFPAPPLWILPVAALYVAGQGDAEEAAALLSLSCNHPLSRCGWLTLWPPLAGLQEELEQQLGSAAFEAAWEEGAQRDTGATVAALLARETDGRKGVTTVGRAGPRETAHLVSLLQSIASGTGPHALPAEAAELMPVAAELQSQLARMEQMEQELELARQVQQRMLPRAFPQVPGYQFASRSIPARVVGGDFYDVIELDGGRFGLAIADVADKGMPAALFMALTRSLLLAEARRADSPRDVLHKVNDLLLQMGGGEMFVTLFYGVVDTAQRLLTYARAGHDHPYLLRDAQVTQLDGAGMVLGLFPAEELALVEEELALAAGDRLVLYSDGLTDALAPGGESYSRERLAASFLRHAAAPPEHFCQAVIDEVTDFQGGALPYDDMTLLLVAVE